MPVNKSQKKKKKSLSLCLPKGLFTFFTFSILVFGIIVVFMREVRGQECYFNLVQVLP